jgi:copper chaperone CopZ
MTILLLVCFGLSCRRQDIRSVTIRVPAMRSAACTNIVSEALQRAQSIPPDWIHADIDKRTVTVTYDSLQRAIKNLEFAIADAGFQANDTPANPQAATNLPPECR